MSDVDAHPQLRVSALQRENAVAKLREAAADGRITFDELGPRLDRALGAVTRADLIAVLNDLVEPDRLASVITDEQVLGDGPGYRFDNPLVLTEETGLKRIGPWRVPPFMEAVTGWSDVRLNFVMAEPGAKLIDLVLLSGGGACVLVVPQGWGVDTERLQISGQQKSAVSRVSTRPTGDNPRIVVRGRSAGNVKVRHPNWFDKRQLRREVARIDTDGAAPPAIEV